MIQSPGFSYGQNEKVIIADMAMPMTEKIRYKVGPYVQRFPNVTKLFTNRFKNTQWKVISIEQLNSNVPE